MYSCKGETCPTSKKNMCTRFTEVTDEVFEISPYDGKGPGCRYFVKRKRRQRTDTIQPTSPKSCTHDIYSTKTGQKVCLFCSEILK